MEAVVPSTAVPVTIPSWRMWQSGLNVVFALVITMLTYPNWSFLFWKVRKYLDLNVSTFDVSLSL